MKLQVLASKPQLIKIVIDDEQTVARFGESIEFYVHDRQDMDTYLKLASLEGNNDLASISEVVKDLVLDEKGNKILKNGVSLPAEVIIKVIEKTVANLGNQLNQTTDKSPQK